MPNANIYGKEEVIELDTDNEDELVETPLKESARNFRSISRRKSSRLSAPKSSKSSTLNSTKSSALKSTKAFASRTSKSSAPKLSKRSVSKTQKRAADPSPKTSPSKTLKSKRQKSSISPTIKDSSRSKSTTQGETSLNPSKSSDEVSIEDFKSRLHASRWPSFSKRHIWPERKIHKGDFTQCEAIIYHLMSLGLEKTYTDIKPFVWKIIQEFYCNLDPDVKNPADTYYGRVYVRGHTFNFSPTVINEYLCCNMSDSENFVPDYNKIIFDISGGVRRIWPHGKDFPASQLTVKYAILHKIAMRNWMPTSHRSGVNKAMAVLLFKIGNSVSFDFGKHLFDQIMKHEDGKNERLVLPFPSLIYGILTSQQSIIRENEVLFVEKEEIRISYKLQMGKHVNDLEGFVKGLPISTSRIDSALLTRSVKFLVDMSKSINIQISVLEKQKSVISELLNDIYKKNPHMEATDPNDRATEEAGTSGVQDDVPDNVPENVDVQN